MSSPTGVQKFEGSYGPHTPPPGAQQFQGNYGPQPPPPGCQQLQGYYGPQLPPPGTQKFLSNYGPHQGMYRDGDPDYSPGPISSPMGMRNTHPVRQGNPSFSNAPGRGNWFNNSPCPRSGYGSGSYPGFHGSPDFRSSPQGRGQWSNNSPNPVPGHGCGSSPGVERGRDQWDSSRMNPNSRYSGGKGRFHSDGQARSFYNKSMVEDPWESLSSIIWDPSLGDKENDVRNFTNNRGFFQKTPTFQKNPIAKKPRVSETFDTSNSKKGGSLADFLAESFDEAVEDAASC